jgi:hypothetical protein
MDSFYALDQWEVREVAWTTSGFRVYHTVCNRAVDQASIGDEWACQGCWASPPKEMIDVIYLARMNKDKRSSKPLAFYGFVPPRPFPIKSGYTLSIKFVKD